METQVEHVVEDLLPLFEFQRVKKLTDKELTFLLHTNQIPYTVIDGDVIVSIPKESKNFNLDYLPTHLKSLSLVSYSLNIITGKPFTPDCLQCPNVLISYDRTCVGCAHLSRP